MRFILLIILLFPIQILSQIVIDDVGDGWKKNVKKSLELIQKVDSSRYKVVIKQCKRIGFWNNKFSTTEGNDVILISRQDIQSGNINNISAIIIHESKHLYYMNNNVFLDERDEEILCYRYEMDFLKKIPSVEDWLIKHCENMINHYRNLKQ
jgi:hypothetical protein